ncbi:hypothetical protein [Ruegeria sp. MALMAid1280]|uniref:hypothetical protein n=1 Tax=Ruegeria sp. MALMAid1280 TaxID=3411634 RepID=UPI003B9ED5BA
MLVLVLPEFQAATLDQPYLIGVALALAMAVLTAGAKIQIRSLAQTENAGSIAFYFALTSAVAGAASGFWGWVAPDLLQLTYLCGAGIAGGIAHIMMTLALQHSETSKLAPFEYLSLIFAVITDFLLFGFLPDGAFYISTAMILVAMWAITFKDQVALRKKASKAA